MRKRNNISSNYFTINKNSILRFSILMVSLIVALTSSAAKRALLVGISEYPAVAATDASWSAIHGANDVKLISPTLKGQGFAVTELTGKAATATAVRRSLATLAKTATKGDLVYIQFSGHGQPFEDKSGDEADGWDEAIIPYDAHSRYHKGYKGQNHILDDELEKAINKIRTKVGPTGYVYVVLDACHMGGASRDESESEEELYVRGTDRGFSSSSKRFIPKIDRRAHMKIASKPNMAGICYIEACRSYQTNAEIKENGNFYGPLTFYINQTLRSVTLSSDSKWTDRVVRAMAKDKRLIKQNPVIETDK